MKKKQCENEDDCQTPTLCRGKDVCNNVRRGPFDGPVIPPDGWIKMKDKSIAKGFRKWKNGDWWVAHEKGEKGCWFGGKRCVQSKFINQTPWGLMDWLNHIEDIFN